MPAWQLPFENGQRWQAGAPHTVGGNNVGVRSTVDFGPIAGSNGRVVTIASGTVYQISCAGGVFLGVDHGNGWRSTYYHLTNQQTGLIGRSVPAGTYLGEAGRAIPCGGFATFNHVHLQILRDGQPMPLDGVRFGGYTVHSTGSDYHGFWNNTAGQRVLTNNGLAACCLTSTTVPGGGAPTEGSLVRVTDNSEVYKIVGGAPIYQASLNGVPHNGMTDISRAQLNQLPQFPRDGTFIAGTPSGKVYRIAGGAPLYVSTWNSYGGAQPVQVIYDAAIDQAGNGGIWKNLNRYPANGTFISNIANGRVYRIAYGAPLYVSTWDHFGGPQPTTSIDPFEFREYQHLRRVPADGFLRGVPSGRIFRVVGDGRPHYVPSWTPHGGPQPYVDVSDFAIDNCDQLECSPLAAYDQASGGAGFVSVIGWAVDTNAPKRSSVIHAYIGGPLGDRNAEGVDLGPANLSRPDVDRVYPGLGKDHGFNAVVSTTKRGRQSVHLYALNVPGTPGGFSYLGSKTVTITEPVLAGGSSAPVGPLLANNGNILRLQSDGNLVVYSKQGSPLWSSGTGGAGANARLSMQTDGNLVLYSAAGRPIWNSGTHGQGVVRLSLQADGTLVLQNAAGSTVWSSRAPDSMSAGGVLTAGQALVSADARTRLVMQSDGNLVVYVDGRPRWHTSSAGSPSPQLRLQRDGNLVLYSGNGARWASMTFNANRLVVQNDGNVVLLSSNRPVWSTGTHR